MRDAPNAITAAGQRNSHQNSESRVAQISMSVNRADSSGATPRRADVHMALGDGNWPPVWSEECVFPISNPLPPAVLARATGRAGGTVKLNAVWPCWRGANRAIPNANTGDGLPLPVPLRRAPPPRAAAPSVPVDLCAPVAGWYSVGHLASGGLSKTVGTVQPKILEGRTSMARIVRVWPWLSASCLLTPLWGCSLTPAEQSAQLQASDWLVVGPGRDTENDVVLTAFAPRERTFCLDAGTLDGDVAFSSVDVRSDDGRLLAVTLDGILVSGSLRSDLVEALSFQPARRVVAINWGRSADLFAVVLEGEADEISSIAIFDVRAGLIAEHVLERALPSAFFGRPVRVCLSWNSDDRALLLSLGAEAVAETDFSPWATRLDAATGSQQILDGLTDAHYLTEKN